MSKTHTYRGFTIARGSFSGTTDDRADGWYADAIDADFNDRRGSGFRLLADAKAWVDEVLASEDFDQRLRAA
jgi:hypothetical protein